MATESIDLEDYADQQYVTTKRHYYVNDMGVLGFCCDEELTQLSTSIEEDTETLDNLYSYYSLHQKIRLMAGAVIAVTWGKSLITALLGAGVSDADLALGAGALGLAIFNTIHTQRAIKAAKIIAEEQEEKSNTYNTKLQKYINNPDLDKQYH